jgi:hypothetical protein
MKMAEFRQAWINTLRDTLSEFQSLGVTPGLNPLLMSDFYKLGTKIELLMNPKDVDYAELDGLLYSFLSKATAPIEEKFSINPNFVEVSQRILKREWDRLNADLNKLHGPTP